MTDLKVTLLQSNLVWEDSAKNLKMFSEKISRIDEPTDLIVLPEMFPTGFTMNAKNMAEEMNGTSMKWMEKVAREKRCVVTGSIIISESGKYYNRLIWMSPEGIEHYDKRHLFSYAGEDKIYSAGRERKVMRLKDWDVLPLVCYDLRFPVWSRRNKRQDYDLLIYVANWPERRSHAWKQLLIARAIENQCYVVGMNRTGNDGNNINHSGESAVIDFKGDYLLELKDSDIAPVTVTLSKDPLEAFRKQFAFQADADEFRLVD